MDDLWYRGHVTERGNCLRTLHFQILWKSSSRCDILVAFPSHLKKNLLHWDFDLKSWSVDFFTFVKKYFKRNILIKISIIYLVSFSAVLKELLSTTTLIMGLSRYSFILQIQYNSILHGAIWHIIVQPL